jgi:hypothetical protein
MTFEALCAEVRTEFPSFVIKDKSTSFFMKLVNLFLRIVTFGKLNEFMTAFITTIGYTVYVPDGWDQMRENDRVAVLRHERIHMRQRRKYSAFLFSFLYLVPFFPLGLAYFRARFEMEAYTETMRAAVDDHGKVILKLPAFKANIVAHFTTGQYGWMWPFKKTVERWYDEAASKILSP